MLIQDLKYALRSFGQKPLFAAVVVFTLALGIGGNTAIFSVVNGVLLKPLPYGDPERLVMVWSRWKGWDKTWVSDAEALDYDERARTIEAVGAWSGTSVNLTGEGEPERVSAAAITANLLPVLAVSPVVGRNFTVEEDTPGGDAVAILADSLWQRRYGGDPGLVGRTVQVDGRSRLVVGIMPSGFVLPLDYQEEGATEIWVPLAIDRQNLARGSHGYFAAGRLAPGATVAQATAELKAITSELTRDGQYHPDMRFEAFAVSVLDEIAGEIRPALLVLLGAVAFLLLIACANVANLLMARAEARQREIAVRTALGAGRARLIRQLLTESVSLALAGGAVGLGLAYGGTWLLRTWSPASVPRLSEIGVDGRVLLFTLAVAIATGVFFGFAPAVRASRFDLTDSLKEGGLGSTVGVKRQWFRRFLVVVELALAVVLSIGAGLMLRSFWELQKIRPGFDPKNVLTVRLSLPQATYPEPRDVVRFYDGLLERVRALPGAEHVGAVRLLPLTATMGDWGLAIEGREPTPGDNPKGDWQVVSEGYLEAMKIRLVEGRTLAKEDRADSGDVAVINETMAARYWPGRSPIGKRMRMGDQSRPWITVVGVVGDVRHNGIRDVVKEKFYRPLSQFPNSTGRAIRAMSLVVKTRVDPQALLPSLRQDIRAMDPNVPIYDVQTMDQVVAASVSEPRFTLLLLGLFAGVSLLLASVGIYGVLSYLVGQRTHEIGIRMALGAKTGSILKMILSQAALLGLAGCVLGVILALAVTRLMAGLLYGVRATDPVTFVLIPLFLLAVALFSSYAPARRAARVDPNEALRVE